MNARHLFQAAPANVPIDSGPYRFATALPGQGANQGLVSLVNPLQGTDSHGGFSHGNEYPGHRACRSR